MSSFAGHDGPSAMLYARLFASLESLENVSRETSSATHILTAAHGPFANIQDALQSPGRTVTKKLAAEAHSAAVIAFKACTLGQHGAPPHGKLDDLQETLRRVVNLTATLPCG